jgi:hypothetical protein
VVPASEYGALENQVRELQRMLGKKTMENEILREAISRVAGPENAVAHALVAGGRPVSAVANTLGSPASISRQPDARPLHAAAAELRCPRRSSPRVSKP